MRLVYRISSLPFISFPYQIPEWQVLELVPVWLVTKTKGRMAIHTVIHKISNKWFTGCLLFPHIWFLLTLCSDCPSDVERIIRKDHSQTSQYPRMICSWWWQLGFAHHGFHQSRSSKQILCLFHGDWVLPAIWPPHAGWKFASHAGPWKQGLQALL